jgi:RNA polymerase sigma-70 factor (ECF subfamily)
VSVHASDHVFAYFSSPVLIFSTQPDLSIEEHMSTVTVFEVPKKPHPEEFRQIFDQYHDLAYRTAYSITRRAEDAEDVVQTIFLQLLRSSRALDWNRNPQGYVYRAAVNLSLKSIRSRERYALTGNSEQFEAAVPADDSGSKEEMDRRLWSAIAQLSESAAQMVILRYIHEYSLTEIARMMDTTRSTVAVSLFRSRARLKKLIRASQAGEQS